MNKRIKELYKQAFGYFPAPIGDPELEKFAELIVKECMNICKQHPSRILSNRWDADAVTPDIVHRFEEHFGVEE